jgi:hypothetical protein
MKIITVFFRAMNSLGWLGLIMLLMAGVMIYSLFGQPVSAFGDNLAGMDALDTLDSDVTFKLNDMQLDEAYKVFELEYSKPQPMDYAVEAEKNYSQITQSLNEMVANDDFTAEDIKPFLDDLSAHREKFKTWVSDYQANQMDDARGLLDELQLDNAILKDDLRQLVMQVEQERLASQKEFSLQINAKIRVVVVGLSTILLLGLIGYQIIAGKIRPLGMLTNAITSIGGDQYRPELLGYLTKQGDRAGKLARALDGLATSLDERDSGWKKQIEKLKQELYESRHKRLKITRPVKENRSVQQ